MVNPQPQLRRKVVPGYQLEDNIDKGYKEAVQGNQTNLAFRYLELIMERQAAEIAELKSELATVKESLVAPTRTQTPATKPKTEAKKDEEGTG